MFVSQLIEKFLSASQWIWEIIWPFDPTSGYNASRFKTMNACAYHLICTKPLQTFLVSELHEIVHFSTNMASQSRRRITVFENFKMLVNFQNMKITKRRYTLTLQLNCSPFRLIEKSMSKVKVIMKCKKNCRVLESF